MAIATDDDTLLDGLNPAQREAVLHMDGPLLVLAGAGSGKTRVLTARIARLIDHHGVDPARILAVTFTNKAAGEMRDRIARLLGRAPLGMWVGTFHAIGARLLRAAPHLVGRTPSFTIYDQDDSQTIVKRILDRHQLNTKQFTPRGVQGAISDAKNALVSPEEYAKVALDPFSRAVATVYADLERDLRLANAADFDDLLVLPVRLLSANPEVLEKYRRRFQYLLVDEYQDTNRAQYQFVRLLAGERGNLCVVGDDDQSIYGWRGADIRNILDFRKDFPDAHVVRLEENYRSTPEVLDLANIVISANTGRMGKTLRATRPSGERVTRVHCLDERDEADFVVEEISARRAAGAGASLRDFAVVYRTNSQSRAMEEALRKRSVPYRLVGTVRFYDRREIRDLMSYLKLIANPADDEAFRRAVVVPRRGLGETTIEQLALAAREAGIPMLAPAELDKLGPDADAVTLMTLHNAKGLEFPVVFITGLEDGLFPLARAYDEPALLEEERRLFYVGITRAERKLFLSHAEERRRNGEFFPSKPSSVLAGIFDGLLELRKTIKVRSSGRSFMNSMSGGQWRGRGAGRARDGHAPAPHR